MSKLDDYITSGRYRADVFNVVCSVCDLETTVTAETEFGATEWVPDECANCGEVFKGDEVERDAPTSWEEW